MHRGALLFLLPALLPAVNPTPGYRASVEKWREQREAALKTDTGWLTVAGLFWLNEGDNRCGSAPDAVVALPAGRAPAKVGTFLFNAGKTSFRPVPGLAVRVNGKPAIGTVQLKSDADGSPDQISFADFTMFVIKRGPKYGIRLKDLHSEMRRNFHGLKWYPVKEGYRIQARFVSYHTPQTLAVPNILGQTEDQPSPGYAVFRFQGHEYRLDPVLEDKQLFFVFRDLTSGKTTYGAGRFLYADLPKEGKIVLDFNKAYNPPCAFTPYATCPLPPKQNRLKIALEAGELKYGDH